MHGRHPAFGEALLGMRGIIKCRKRECPTLQQPPLELEEDPQHLGNHEDDLAMRDTPKQPFSRPIAPYFDSISLAGRATPPRFIGKRQQTFCLDYPQQKG